MHYLIFLKILFSLQLLFQHHLLDLKILFYTMHTSYFTQVALPLCLTASGVDSHSNPCQNMPHTWQADVTRTLTPKRWVTTVPAAVSRTTGSHPKTSIPAVCHNLNSVAGLRVSKKRTAMFWFFLFSMFWTSGEAPCVTSLRYHSSEKKNSSTRVSKILDYMLYSTSTAVCWTVNWAAQPLR